MAGSKTALLTQRKETIQVAGVVDGRKARFANRNVSATVHWCIFATINARVMARFGADSHATSARVVHRPRQNTPWGE